MLCTQLDEEELYKRDWTGYSFQIKYDGRRVQAKKQDGKVTLIPRSDNINDWKYPEIMEALEKIQGNWHIDGEMSVYDEKTHRTNFEMLISRDKTKDKFKIKLMTKKFPATFVVFDILEWDGINLRDRSFLQRMELLRELYSGDARIEIADVSKDPVPLMRLAHENNWEGIVGKKDDSIYEDNPNKHEIRSLNWFKVPIVEYPTIKFTGYEINPKGATLYNEEKIRCQCAGAQSVAVREAIDKYGIAIVKCARKGGRLESGMHRQITFVELVV
jgi:DNA ligase-1